MARTLARAARARVQGGVNLALDVLHATSVQALIVQWVDASVHPLYGEATQ